MTRLLIAALILVATITFTSCDQAAPTVSVSQPSPAPATATLTEQIQCATAAKTWLKDDENERYYGTLDTSHYNGKLNRCFVKVPAPAMAATGGHDRISPQNGRYRQI